jgi:hypothetical protein
MIAFGKRSVINQIHRFHWVCRDNYIRVRRGWRYVRRRMTEDDAIVIRNECYRVSGDFPLSYLSLSPIVEEMRERYGGNPKLEDLARSACLDVWSHWTGSGDLASCAEELVWDKINEWAAEDGITLVEIGDEEPDQHDALIESEVEAYRAGDGLPKRMK